MQLCNRKKINWDAYIHAPFRTNNDYCYNRFTSAMVGSTVWHCSGDYGRETKSTIAIVEGSCHMSLEFLDLIYALKE